MDSSLTQRLPRALSPVRLAEETRRVRRDFWGKFRRVAARIPFAHDLLAAYYCAMDPATPLRVRGILVGALAYFILPTDAVPDLLAVVGFTDDAAVLMLAVTTVAAHITPAHRDAASRTLDEVTITPSTA